MLVDSSPEVTKVIVTRLSWPEDSSNTVPLSRILNQLKMGGGTPRVEQLRVMVSGETTVMSFGLVMIVTATAWTREGDRENVKLLLYY